MSEEEKEWEYAEENNKDFNECHRRCFEYLWLDGTPEEKTVSSFHSFSNGIDKAP